MFPTDSDIDQSELGQLTKVIAELDDKSDELSDDLKNNSRDAEDVAESILRFDDAIQDVVDHYDDWMSALSNGSMQ
jgi:septal ring factor EnvC (AmiA/AmiB activator)